MAACKSSPIVYISDMNMNPDLCRGGRGLLNWSRADLAEKAGVSTPVVVKYERGGNLREETLAKLVEAFSAHGVTFPPGRGVERIERRSKPQ